MNYKYVKPEIISLKNNANYNEKWLQTKIEEDPSIIGLGDLEFRDTEKFQIGGGRLDTILYDPEDKRRYEVEIQLGKTDESHIIRTIEYWDLERKKNPQYEHCAVIIAEDITSRFLNVISLFNGFIPLIAIQVKAIKVNDNISLFFTKVLDEVKFELLDEDTTTETTDRAYWEKKATKDTLKLIDKIFSELNEITTGYNLKYNKYYIGLEQNNIANNFIYFKPRKSTVIVNFRVEKTEELDKILENSDIELLNDNQIYRFRITDNDLKSKKIIEIIKIFAQKAKEEYRN